MDRKRVFVLLIGERGGEVDHFQLLQEQTALAEGRRLGLEVEVAFAPAFDQPRVLVRRLGDQAAPPVDAVVTEPANTAALDLVVEELRGRTGLIVLSAWGSSVERAAAAWPATHPMGTVSTDHRRVGEIQAEQASALVPSGGRVLYVAGPLQSSAAQERLEGFQSRLAPAIEVKETAAASWTEVSGRTAFENWYRIAKARDPIVQAICGASDELAVGARHGCEALTNADHRQALLEAKFLGVDACPTYGQKLVAQGLLTASVLTPANTGLALAHLHRFWSQGTPVPLRSFTEARPWPR